MRYRKGLLLASAAVALLALAVLAWSLLASVGSNSAVSVVEIEIAGFEPGGGPPPAATSAPSGEPAPTEAAESVRQPSLPKTRVSAQRPPQHEINVATVDAAAFDGLTVLPPGPALIPAPAAGLFETGPDGPLPKIDEDGRKPWNVYARPFDAGDPRPRVAIIILGAGLSRTATLAAIRHLPGAVTLAFDAHSPPTQLAELIRLARRQGHEVLITVPLEPIDAPFDDAGPFALRESLSPEENVVHLESLLSHAPGHVGIITLWGERFRKRETTLRPMLATLKHRGILYVDGPMAAESRAPQLAEEMGVEHVAVDVDIDSMPTPTAIDKALDRLETIARQRVVAVGVAQPRPETIKRIAAWAATLHRRNITLAPISAVADMQGAP